MEYIQAMRDPDFDPKSDSGKMGRGCSAVGWTFFGFILVVSVIFSVKFFNYYQKLKNDGQISLPQAAGSMTPRDGMVFGTQQEVVPDSELLSANSAGYGAGVEEAKLVIVEFGDFGCPFCKQVSLPLRRLVGQHKDQVRLVYRHYASESIHPNAIIAAQAAECAGEQGKFWQMYDKLYLNSPAIGFDDLIRYGQEINLADSQFEICLTSERYLDRVNSDIFSGRSIGVAGTPTFFFNGQRVVGALPEESLRRVIEVFLAMEE